MKTRHVFVSHVTKKHVNKKKVEKKTQHLCQPKLEKLDIFAELELEKIKLISHV